MHTLKIDRSFIIDMAVSPEGLALVSTIIHLAHSLDCDEMQGYLVSKPLPRDIFEAKYLRVGSVGGAAGASHT